MTRYYPLPQQFPAGSGFGPRGDGFHSGTDFPAPDGTPFHACQGGTVQFIGPATGYGQWLVIDHPTEDGGGCTEYGHMWDAYATGLHVGARVEAGQHIGYVGSNGGSTGPHLHLAVMPHAYDPNNKIDPMPWLAGSRYPGEAPPPVNPSGETVFGLDISNHQGGFDFAAAAGEGFAFCTHKITEADYYADEWWPRAKEQMAQHFPGRWGGYVFCRMSAHPEAEADWLAAHAGSTDFPLQIDYEDTDGGGSLDDLHARINAYRARGFETLLPIYLPRWFWESRMGAPDLSSLPVGIWNSHYGGGGGTAHDLYWGAGGDSHPGWNPFPGKGVEILQFTETAWVAGQSVDANAIKGGINSVTRIFGGEVEDMPDETWMRGYFDPLISDIKDLREQETGSRDTHYRPDGSVDLERSYPGWPQIASLPRTDAISVIGWVLRLPGFDPPQVVKDRLSLTEANRLPDWNAAEPGPAAPPAKGTLRERLRLRFSTAFDW